MYYCVICLIPVPGCFRAQAAAPIKPELAGHALLILHNITHKKKQPKCHGKFETVNRSVTETEVKV